MTDWLVEDSLAPAEAFQRSPFHEAAGEGRLVLPVCGACGVALELDQTCCHRCGAEDRRWKEVALRAVVHAATQIHRLRPPEILTEQPYWLIDAEFRTGHRLVLTTTHQWTGTPPVVGKDVPIGFRTVGGVSLPGIDLHET